MKTIRQIIAVFLALFIFAMPVMAQEIHAAAKSGDSESTR